MPHFLNFTDWRNCLRRNAAMADKSKEIEFLSDHVLSIFWERSCEPTVAAIIDDAKDVQAA